MARGRRKGITCMQKAKQLRKNNSLACGNFRRNGDTIDIAYVTGAVPWTTRILKKA